MSGAARRTLRQARPGIEPVRSWQALRGELPAAIQHNGLLHAMPSFARGARSVPALRATPVMSGAAAAPARASARGTSPCPPNTQARAVTASPSPQASKHGAASGAVIGLAPPAHHPPPGGSPAHTCVLAQRSAVLAASRPSPAGAREARGLDPAATRRSLSQATGVRRMPGTPEQHRARPHHCPRRT